MDTLYRRMARERLLQRDAHAALRALSGDERQALRRAGAGDILDLPVEHKRRLVEFCLGIDREAGFQLTDLGRCAADLVGAHDKSNDGAPVAPYDPVELALGMAPGSLVRRGG